MGSEAVLQEIMSGLTGDRTMDAVYLWHQAVQCNSAGCSEKVINESAGWSFCLLLHSLFSRDLLYVCPRGTIPSFFFIFSRSAGHGIYWYGRS